MALRYIFGSDLFISYARADGKEYAKKLKERLSNMDYACFIDYDKLYPGDELGKKLEYAIKRSRAFVLVGTDGVRHSEHVPKELTHFFKTGRKLIPINIQGALKNPTPWEPIRGDNLIWIDEPNSAEPSQAVYDEITRLFKHSRRNVWIRSGITTAALLLLAVSFVAFWQGGVARANQRQAEANQKAAEENQRKAEETLKQLRAEQETVRTQTTRLQEEQLKLKRKTEEAQKNAEQARRQTELARSNAEKAREQEALALSNAEKAERRQKAAESLSLTEQSRQEYMTNPLLGLALSLEALSHAPGDDEPTRATIESAIRDRIQHGRIARLDESDFGEPYFLDGSSFFVLGRPDQTGELRDLKTGSPIKPLSGEVTGVSYGMRYSDFGKDPEGQSVHVSQHLPYFVIHYKGPFAELRRRTDAGVVASGNFYSVGLFFTLGDPYFLVRFHDKPSELLHTSDGAKAPVTFLDKGERKAHVTFLPRVPYFMVRHPDNTAEVRRVGTNELVEVPFLNVLNKRRLASSPDIQFSRDLSHYLVEYSPALGEWVRKFFRTDTHREVELSGKVKGVYFSPVSDQYVVAYEDEDRRGELRRTDQAGDADPITLNGRVRHVVFNTADRHFVVLYEPVAPGKPITGEVRSADDKNTVIPLPAYIQNVYAPKKGLGFETQDFYDPVLFYVNGTRLEELPPWDLESDENARPNYVLARDPVSGAREIRRAATGDVVRPTGKLANAACFRYLTRIPYISIGCDSSKPGGILHTGTGKLTEGEFSPSYITLSPKGTLFVGGYVDGSFPLYRKATGELIRSLGFKWAISPDDEYVVTHDGNALWEFVWTNTGNRLKLSGQVAYVGDDPYSSLAGVTFNATSSLVKIKYGDKPTELRLTADGSILMTVKDVSFSPDGHYFVVTYDTGRSELWAERDFKHRRDFPHRLADLEAGLAGVQFDAANGHAFVWYNDRHAYLLDLNWLNAIGGKPEDLFAGKLINIACQPFANGRFDSQSLKHFVGNAPLQLCLAGR